MRRLSEAELTILPEPKSANLVQVGLVGQGIQQSRTPLMHEAEGASLGLNYCYRVFDVDEMRAPVPSLLDILRAAEICGYAGLNVTFPYKVEMTTHLDELSENARKVGAVNTVVLRDGKRIGHNTDLWGFAESFKRRMPGVARDNVLLIGAGGAGAAVVHALIANDVQTIWIADVDHARAEALAKSVNETHGFERARATQQPLNLGVSLDGVVNASPVGMAKIPGSAVPLELLRPEMWVADIVYFPLETELLRMARGLGCKTMNGAGMAVFQAVRAFELFTQIAPDSARMEAIFDAFEH